MVNKNNRDDGDVHRENPKNLQNPSKTTPKPQKNHPKPPKLSKTNPKTSKTPQKHPKTSKLYKHRKIIDPDGLEK